MALPSTMVFEIRPGSGSDTQCGGGFNAARLGTDYTLQPSAQATGTVTSVTTTVTATTAIFTAVMVGNIITDGTTFKEITGFTSTTIVTVDSSPSWSATTIYVGGALATIAKADPLLTAGMTAWIKADGTDQTITAAISMTISGDSTSGPITWAGYHSTRGDHDGTKPLIQTSTNNAGLVLIGASGGSFRQFDNIEIKSTAGTPGNGFRSSTSINVQAWVISNCKISGCKNGILSDNSTSDQIRQLSVINTEITGCTIDGMNVVDVTTVDGCYIHGNSGYGIRIPSAVGTGQLGTPFRISNTVIYGNTLGGIYALNGTGYTATTGILLDINRCAIVSNTNDGIQIAVANAKLVMVSFQNTIIYGNSGYGINITNVAAFVSINRYNAYGSNSSGARNNLAVGTSDVTLSADPFTGRTVNDFSLNGTPGGGASCRAVGFPGTIAGCASSGSSDIGAQQTAGATFVAPGPFIFGKGSPY